MMGLAFVSPIFFRMNWKKAFLEAKNRRRDENSDNRNQKTLLIAAIGT